MFYIILFTLEYLKNYYTFWYNRTREVTFFRKKEKLLVVMPYDKKIYACPFMTYKLVPFYLETHSTRRQKQRRLWQRFENRRCKSWGQVSSFYRKNLLIVPRSIVSKLVSSRQRGWKTIPGNEGRSSLENKINYRKSENCWSSWSINVTSRNRYRVLIEIS